MKNLFILIPIFAFVSCHQKESCTSEELIGSYNAHFSGDGFAYDHNVEIQKTKQSDLYFEFWPEDKKSGSGYFVSLVPTHDNKVVASSNAYPIYERDTTNSIFIARYWKAFGDGVVRCDNGISIELNLVEQTSEDSVHFTTTRKVNVRF